jgi:transmembrane sensor
MSDSVDIKPQADDGQLPDLIQQAGEWLLRLTEDDLSPEEIAAWLEWYHAAPAHRQTFDQLQREYEQFKAIPAAQRLAMAEQLQATTLALQPSRSTTVRTDAVPHATQHRRRSRLGPAAMAATIVLAVSVVLWRSGWLPTAEAQTGIYQTERGVHQAVNLPDGSQLALGGDSAASFRFTDEARYIVLESGEAYFQVAHDRSRPFIVNVGGTTVRAVGTAFNIRRSAERVVVTVSEGIVDVQRATDNASAEGATSADSGPARSVRLSAGEEVVLALREIKPLTVKPADPEAATAWQSGRLEFVDEPLSGVIATINRYSRREVVITSRELGKLTLTGSVMDNHIDEWLISLQDILPMTVVAVSESTVLLAPSIAALENRELELRLRAQQNQ